MITKQNFILDNNQPTNPSNLHSTEVQSARFMLINTKKAKSEQANTYLSSGSHQELPFYKELVHKTNIDTVQWYNGESKCLKSRHYRGDGRGW